MKFCPFFYFIVSDLPGIGQYLYLNVRLVKLIRSLTLFSIQGACRFSNKCVDLTIGVSKWAISVQWLPAGAPGYHLPGRRLYTDTFL